MYKRTSDLSSIPADRTPRILGDAELVHRAVYSRSRGLRDEWPGSMITEELQDQEPRGVVRVKENGRTVRVEFFESTFSADQVRFLEEYVQAARECGDIALLYPGLSFPEEYVVRKIEEVMDRAKAAGIRGEIAVHGFLYDSEGEAREIV